MIVSAVLAVGRIVMDRDAGVLWPTVRVDKLRSADTNADLEPADKCVEPSRLRLCVHVQEHEHITGRRFCSLVACVSKPEVRRVPDHLVGQDYVSSPIVDADQFV